MTSVNRGPSILNSADLLEVGCDLAKPLMQAHAWVAAVISPETPTTIQLPSAASVGRLRGIAPQFANSVGTDSMAVAQGAARIIGKTGITVRNPAGRGFSGGSVNV